MTKYTKHFFLFVFVQSFFFVPINASVKIMPLGNSITWDWYYGDNRPDAYRSGYRSHLWYKLKGAGFDINFVGSRHNGNSVTPPYDGDNEGYTGWTTYQIANRVYTLLNANTPDIILLHIGTNDSAYYSPTTGVAGVEAILDEIERFENRKNKKIKVILAKIVNLSKNPSWVNSFNSQLGAMVQQRINNGDDIVLVNMQNAVGWNLIDGIHPTTNGYKIMASKWFDVLKTILPQYNNYSFLVPMYNLILN